MTKASNKPTPQGESVPLSPCRPSRVAKVGTLASCSHRANGVEQPEHDHGARKRHVELGRTYQGVIGSLPVSPPYISLTPLWTIS